MMYNVIQTKLYPTGDEVEVVATCKTLKTAMAEMNRLRAETWQTWIVFSVVPK